MHSNVNGMNVMIHDVDDEKHVDQMIYFTILDPFDLVVQHNESEEVEYCQLVEVLIAVNVDYNMVVEAVVVDDKAQ